jgi:hypothetical protein
MSATNNPEVCPVIGTVNTTLPPTHPDIDLSKPGQVCPVVGAKTEHHHNLHKHPSVTTHEGVQANDALSCPVARSLASQPKSQAMDDGVCPVVGPATTVLPPDHPSTSGKSQDAECPVTKAKVGHHLGKVMQHPSVEGAPAGAVCPVVGHA